MNTMLRYLLSGAIGVALLFSAATAWAQPPQGGVDIGTAVGVDTDYKTPQLKDSDTILIPLAVHAPPGPLPHRNWAGAIVGVHVLDATEVDVDAITSPMGTGWTQPFGPRSENQQSLMQNFTAWHPNAQGSGTTLNQSQNTPVLNLTLHAKNTDPINNSDRDIQLKFWNINHLPAGPGSAIIGLQPSDWVYGNPGSDPIEISHFPTDPPQPGFGTWYHVMQPKTFHVSSGIGSAFYATFANSAWIGIEHVPEPAGFVLLFCGGGAAGMAWIIRRRRKHRTT